MVIKSLSPLVSVIIPVHDGQDFIRPCIESVFQQHYPHFEIIVVDDGSTDETASIVKQYEPAVTYVYQVQQGTSCARNHGIRLAKGEYVAFLDHDDLWLPEKLACQVQALKFRPIPDLVFTYLVQFIDDSMAPDERKRIVSNEKAMPGIASSAAFIRRDLFRSVGLFNPSFYLEWPEWYTRAVCSGVNVTIVPRVLVKRRIHHRNKGRMNPASRKEFVRLVKATMDRRRRKESGGLSRNTDPQILQLIT